MSVCPVSVTVVPASRRLGKPSPALTWLAVLLLLLGVTAPARALTAVFNSPTDIPASAATYDATGEMVDFNLGFAPTTGSTLTVVNNTGLAHIVGEFSNLAQGDLVPLTFAGTTYHFVANYFGGTGNDLVLQWAKVRPVAWGWNAFGNLGDGTATNRLIPVPVAVAGSALSGKTILNVLTGEWLSVALCSDGTVATWGANDFGQLGNGSVVFASSAPVQVKPDGVLAGRRIIAVASGGYHVLALCDDGAVVAWGSNDSGELGDGTATRSNEPVEVDAGPGSALDGKKVVALAAGYHFSLALCDDGTVVAWGDNARGQLGIGSNSASASIPVAVDVSGALNGKAVRSLAAGVTHALAICTDGTVAAWGANDSGMLGTTAVPVAPGSQSNSPVLVDVAGLPLGKQAIAVDAGIFHSVALCADGTVAAWGADDTEQLGTGAGDGSSGVPVAVSTLGLLGTRSVESIAVGLRHTIVRCTDGMVAGWGEGSNGELGYNGTADRNVPGQVTTNHLGTGQRVIGLGSGGRSHHTLALAAVGPAALSAPAAGAVSTSPVPVAFSLPEAATPGSLKLTLEGAETIELVLAASQTTLGAHNFLLIPSNPTVSPQVASGQPIPDGTYTVTLSYEDTVQNVWESASSNVTIDTATTPPLLTSPAIGSVTNGLVTVDFTLPEDALAGSLTLTFTAGTNNRVLTLAASEATAGAHAFTFDPAAPTASPQIVSGPAIPDGVYTVTLSYRDTVPNLAAVAASTAVRLDHSTLQPSLISPASNSALGANKNVTLALPEAAAPGSVKLTFDDGVAPLVLVLSTAQEVAGNRSFTFDPANPTASAAIASGPPIPDGIYGVSLSYQDSAGNSIVATAPAANVRVDTAAPTLNGTFAPLVVPAGTLPDYRTQATTTDVSPVTLTQTPTVENAPGSRLVTITATDAAGNQTSTSFTITVRALVKTRILGQGDPAPGRGAVAGLPADAILSTLGLPAIDESGNIVFLAQWRSGTKVKGTGIFTPTECIALAGAPVPGGNGATIKTLLDPVVSNGHVAFLATLANVPKAGTAAVLRKPAGAPLEIVAQSAMEAPGTGGAKFKAFTAAEIRDTSVAFRAQLAAGGGTPKTTGVNDFGLWIKTGSALPALALREGQSVPSSLTLKSFIAFLPGNGSPGQGRGWLTIDNGVPKVLAHATFTNKQQGVLRADAAGNVAVMLQGGLPGAGGGEFTGISFKSFGVPSLNDAGDGAFLATMLVPGGRAPLPVKTMVATLDESATYNTVVPQTELFPASGIKFSLVKDPVLASDGSLAFPATLKGGTAKGLAASTLWWRPAGQPLELLAQGGTNAGTDLLNAQWKSFTSVAIADRGPIFVGTLVPGKGVVSKSSSTGLWAMDFQGNLRLLIRGGDLINIGTGAPADDRFVKSFTVLKAVRGSEGVTRSFNADSQIALLVTFSNNNTSIVRLDVP